MSSGMPGHVLSFNNCPFTWGIWTSSNTRFLGPIRVYNPDGIAIGSAVFEQMTAEFPYTLQWAALSHQNCPFHGGPGPHLIHGSLGQPESSNQTASRLIQSFLVFAGLTTVTDRPTDHATRSSLFSWPLTDTIRLILSPPTYHPRLRFEISSNL